MTRPSCPRRGAFAPLETSRDLDTALGSTGGDAPAARSTPKALMKADPACRWRTSRPLPASQTQMWFPLSVFAPVPTRRRPSRLKASVVINVENNVAGSLICRPPGPSSVRFGGLMSRAAICFLETRSHKRRRRPHLPMPVPWHRAERRGQALPGESVRAKYRGRKRPCRPVFPMRLRRSRGVRHRRSVRP